MNCFASRGVARMSDSFGFYVLQVALSFERLGNPNFNAAGYVCELPLSDGEKNVENSTTFHFRGLRLFASAVQFQLSSQYCCAKEDCEEGEVNR